MAEQRLNIRITAQDEASLLLRNVASTIRSIKPVLFDTKEISRSFGTTKVQIDREMKLMRRSITNSFKNVGKEIAAEISRGLASVGTAVGNNVSAGIEGNILSKQQLKLQTAAARRQLFKSGDTLPLLTGPFTRAKDAFNLAGGLGGSIRRLGEAAMVGLFNSIKTNISGLISIAKRGSADVGREIRALLTGKTLIGQGFKKMMTGGLQQRMEDLFLNSPEAAKKRSDQLKLMDQFSKQQVGGPQETINLLRKQVSLLQKISYLLSNRKKFTPGGGSPLSPEEIRIQAEQMTAAQMAEIRARNLAGIKNDPDLSDIRKRVLATQRAKVKGLNTPDEYIDPNKLIGLGSGLQGVNMQSIAFSAGLLGKGLLEAGKAGLALRSVLLSVFTAPFKALGAFLGKLLSLRNLLLGGGLIILMRRFYSEVRELPQVAIAIEPLSDAMRDLREQAGNLFAEMVRTFGPSIIEGIRSFIDIVDRLGKRVLIVFQAIATTIGNFFSVVKSAWENSDFIQLIINGMRTGIQVVYDLFSASLPVLLETVRNFGSSLATGLIHSFLGTSKMEVAKAIEGGGLGAWLIKGFAGSWGGMDNEIELAIQQLKHIKEVQSQIEDTINRADTLEKMSKGSLGSSIVGGESVQQYIATLRTQVEGLQKLKAELEADAAGGFKAQPNERLKAATKEFSKDFVEIMSKARESMKTGLSQETTDAMDKLTYDVIAAIEKLKSPEASVRISEAGKAAGNTAAKGIGVGMRNGLREIRKELRDTVKLGESLINGLASGIEGGLNSAFDSVIDGTFRVGKALKDMASSVLRQFLSIANRQAALGLTSLIGGLFTPSTPVTSANGNVLRGGFKAFANGGIVTKPTLGLVGEGRMNEAIVPLPDGRSIPVKGMGGNNVYVTIHAIDSQSFQSALAKNGDSIMNIVIGKMNSSPKVRSALSGR